jgi:hypothetical protein
MATITGSFSSNNNNVGIYITWTSTQNINNNTSSVTAKLYVKRKTSYATTCKPSTPISLTINGSTSSDTISVNVGNLSVGSSKLLLTKTVTVTHDSDGAKSISISGKIDFSGHNPGVGRASSTVSLPTIPRATTPTLSTTSANLGASITIDLSSRATSSFTHTLSYKMGSTTNAIVSKTSKTSVSFTIPTSLASLISGTSGKLHFYCTTYNGNTQIGSMVTVSMTVKVSSSSYSPSVTATTTQITGGTNSSVTGYYKGVSKVKVTITATPKEGARISSYTLSVGGVTKTSSSNTITSDIINKTGTLAIIVSATDSRGYSSSATLDSISVKDYSAPSITSFSATRQGIDDDGDLVEMSNGDRIAVKVGYSFNSNVSSSYRTYNLYYGTSSNPTTNASIGSSTSKTISGLSTTSKYYLKYVISDGIKTTSKEITVTATLPLLHLNSSGNGLGIAMSSRDGYMDVGVQLCPRKDIAMGGRKQSNGTKRIYFDSKDGTHDCYFYGGSNTSTTSVGLQDNKNDHAVWMYNGAEQCFKIPSATNFEYGGKEVFKGSINSVESTSKSYFKLGGLAFAWGKVTFSGYSVNTLTSKTVSFPITFSTLPFVGYSHNTSSNVLLVGLGVGDVSSSSFSMNMKKTSGTADFDVYWFAVGGISS